MEALRSVPLTLPTREGHEVSFATNPGEIGVLNEHSVIIDETTIELATIESVEQLAAACNVKTIARLRPIAPRENLTLTERLNRPDQNANRTIKGTRIMFFPLNAYPQYGINFGMWDIETIIKCLRFPPYGQPIA